MRKLIGTLGAAAFAALLGITGAVEHGADIALMWWAVPCLVVLALAAGCAEKIFSRSGSKNRF